MADSLTLTSWIGRVVLGEGLLLLVLVSYVLIYLVARNFAYAYRSRLEIQYGETIIELLFGGGQVAPPTIWLWQELIYRDVILTQIHLLEGPERTKLVSHYVQMGFENWDVRLLDSRAWSRRLGAITRLDSLQLKLDRQHLVRALEDPHPLVALAAARAISRLGEAADPQALFACLERVGARRQDALIEIITNIGARSGAAPVEQHLLMSEKPDVALACARVLGNLHAVEAIPSFLKLLETETTSEIAIAILDALAAIGDPDVAPAVRRHLNHPNAVVKAKAILCLNALGDTEYLKHQTETAFQEAPVEVKRALVEVGWKAVG